MTIQDTVSQNLSILEGATYRITLAYNDAAGDPVDISTGFTAELKARVNLSDVTPVIDLSNGSGLTLGNGTIAVEMTAAETTALDFDKATWNLEITETASSDVNRSHQGIVTLSKDVNY